MLQSDNVCQYYQIISQVLWSSKKKLIPSEHSGRYKAKYVVENDNQAQIN